jgi:hypothetical protein
MTGFLLLVVVGTSIWVFVDARNLGVRRGLIQSGFADMGPGSWLAGCLLIWILVFPLYLVYRPRYIDALRRGESGIRPMNQPDGPVESPPPPPLVSPDGRWVWNGTQWVPNHSGPSASI